jgi:hypothetical protein
MTITKSNGKVLIFRIHVPFWDFSLPRCHDLPNDSEEEPGYQITQDDQAKSNFFPARGVLEALRCKFNDLPAGNFTQNCPLHMQVEKSYIMLLIIEIPHGMHHSQLVCD